MPSEEDSEPVASQSGTAPDSLLQRSDDQPTLFTEQGRLTLYFRWAQPRFADGTLEQDKSYTQQEKAEFFADWLRTLVTDRKLDPRKRLPPYRVFAGKPFFLKEKLVVQVIRQLRDERVLPKRKMRKDKGQPQWTKRDEYCFWLIGHMRAIRIDQLQRVLARWSQEEIESGMLSLSRTVEIVDRWVKKKHAVYRRVFYKQSGWVYMARKGLRHAGLDFRAEAPSERSLEHLYWINEVRMKLEAENPKMGWVSERSIQAEREQRQKGRRYKHIPDGILLLPGSDGGPEEEEIDIEVQISKPSPQKVTEVMGGYWTSGSTNPLRYYVNKQSGGVVRAVYRKMVQERKAMRPRIEIIDLDEWLHPAAAQG
jgi:hypothetical protein